MLLLGRQRQPVLLSKLRGVCQWAGCSWSGLIAAGAAIPDEAKNDPTDYLSNQPFASQKFRF